jgi:hypothetical protein
MSNMKRYAVIYSVSRDIIVEVNVPNGDSPYDYAYDSVMTQMHEDEFIDDQDYEEIDPHDAN